ncbi:MAG: hypothetical protein ABSE96_22420 [Terracidiphilus sp.]|jgi:hypothetical protein
MRYRFNSTAALCLFLAGLTLSPAPMAEAQHEAGQAQGPSKYLFLENDELKPNTSFAYAKSQGEEVQAMREAKAPEHFVGMWGITGANHVLFLHGFDSFADLQKGHEDTFSLPKMIDTLKTAEAGQAPLVASEHDSIYSYEKELSFNPNVDLSKMRFMRILLFHVRSGHDADFRRLAKLFAKAYQSTLPEARWAMFQKMYGVGSDNVYILVTPMESLAVADAMVSGDKKFSEGVGEEQLQTLMKGLDAAVESSESDLFAFDAQLSYVPDSWITSSPDFWGKK